MTQYVDASSTVTTSMPCGANLVAEHVDDVLHDLLHVDALLREDQAIARDARDIEQVVDETYLEIEIPANDLQRTQERLRCEGDEPAVGHRRHDRRERRAQLVAEHREEIVLGVGARAGDLAIAGQFVACVLGLTALLLERLRSVMSMSAVTNVMRLLRRFRAVA